MTLFITLLFLLQLVAVSKCLPVRACPGGSIKANFCHQDATCKCYKVCCLRRTPSFTKSLGIPSVGGVVLCRHGKGRLHAGRMDAYVDSQCRRERLRYAYVGNFGGRVTFASGLYHRSIRIILSNSFFACLMAEDQIVREREQQLSWGPSCGKTRVHCAVGEGRGVLYHSPCVRWRTLRSHVHTDIARNGQITSLIVRSLFRTDKTYNVGLVIV